MPASSALPDLNAHQLQSRGAKRLSAAELQERFAGRCYFGRYQAPFEFVCCFDTEGALWGENNYGTQDRGHWGLDASDDVLTLTWQGGWEHAHAHALLLGPALHLVDAASGRWHSALLQEITPEQITGYQNAPVHNKHI